MKQRTNVEPLKKQPVPELRAAMESVAGIIESNRTTRNKVRELTLMTSAILAPVLTRP